MIVQFSIQCSGFTGQSQPVEVLRACRGSGLGGRRSVGAVCMYVSGGRGSGRALLLGARGSRRASARPPLAGMVGEGRHLRRDATCRVFWTSYGRTSTKRQRQDATSRVSTEPRGRDARTTASALCPMTDWLGKSLALQNPSPKRSTPKKGGRVCGTAVPLTLPPSALPLSEQ
jgi:hypothetical protein